MNNFTKAAASLATSAVISLAFTACSDSTSASDEIFANISSSSDNIENPEESSSSEKATSKESSSSEKSNSKESSSSQQHVSESSSSNTQQSSGVESSSSQVPESSSSEGIKAPSGSFTDARDGKTYKLANIGGQVWMAEDLSYGDSSLYAYSDAGKVCPEGFHLPTIDEFKELVAFAGGEEVAAQKLKSKTGWPSDTSGNWNGTDDYGFNAIPVKSGDGTGTDENFWTATRDFGNYRTANMMKLDPHPTSVISDKYISQFCPGAKATPPHAPALSTPNPKRNFPYAA